MPQVADSRLVVAADHTVSVIGSGSAALNTLMTYDSETESWNNLASGRANATATLLLSGDLLIAGLLIGECATFLKDAPQSPPISTIRTPMMCKSHRHSIRVVDSIRLCD